MTILLERNLSLPATGYQECNSPELDRPFQALLSVLVVFVLVALAPPHLHAAAGSSGGLILDVPVGARAIAMGEAYTALADDSSSLYWNPAGIALLTQSQASFMYNDSIKGLSSQNGAVGTPLERGGLGASLSYLSFGGISGFDQHDIPTSDVNAYSGVGTVGGAYLLGPLSAGLNVKAIQTKLADVSATGVAADLGGIWTLQQEVYGGTIRLGASVRNLGRGLKFIDQRDPLPMQWRLGAAAIQMAQKKLNVSFDVGKERDVNAAFYSGFEYWIVPILALRAGYAGTAQQGNGVRAGLGLKIRDFSFDYAYSAYGDLGMSHRYEISWRFGTVRPLLTPEEKALLKRAKVAMARGRYGEATMLFDSIITLEPDYRPVRQYVREGMRMLERQEASQQFSGSLVLQGEEAGDRAIEVKELADLLQLSEEGEKVSSSKANGTPNAEENTLAPVITEDPPFGGPLP